MGDISVKVILGPITGNSWYSYYSRVERNKERALFNEKHQIGSTIKPILYSVFQEYGKKLSDKVSTKEITLKLLSGNWSPKEAHKITETEITLIDALLKSYNRPVIHLAQEIGFQNIEEKIKPYFKNLQTPLAQYPSELLGSMELSVGELKDIYSQFIKNECVKTRAISQRIMRVYFLPSQILTSQLLKTQLMK